jgi:hypothetical protein
MKRFWLAVFFFAFCLGAAGAVFAADKEPHFVGIKITTGPVSDIPKGRVAAALFIGSKDGIYLKDIPFAWELFKDGESTGKAGKGSTNKRDAAEKKYLFGEITLNGLKDGGDYRLDVWVKTAGWTKDKIASLSFKPQAGKAGAVADELVETDRPRPKGR